MLTAACPTCPVVELFARFFAHSVVLFAAVGAAARLALALLSCSSWALTLPSARVLLPCKAVRLDLAVFPLGTDEGAEEVAFAVEAMDVPPLGWIFTTVGRTLR